MNGTFVQLSLGGANSGSTTVVVPAGATFGWYVNAFDSNGGPGVFTVSASAVVAKSEDIQNLRSLQTSVTKSVAMVSGAAIAGAIDNGIADGFANSGTVTLGPNGGFISFADDMRGPSSTTTMAARGITNPGRNVVGRTPATAFGAEAEADPKFEEAFAALAYAGNVTKAASKPQPRLEREWNLWADIRGSHLQADEPNGNDTRGNQINLTAGLGRKLTSDTLVGLVAGYENFKYDVSALNGTLKGDGSTIGAYFAHRFGGNLRFDAAAAWSNLNYDASAGAASGSFDGRRWLASGGLTGFYRLDTFLLEPSAKVFALWESQPAWTDSLGTLQDGRNFSAGRASFGGKLARPWGSAGNWLISPYVGLYGDFRFSSDNALPVGPDVAAIRDGWSGRATAGLTATDGRGMALFLGGEHGGLGADFQLWSVNLGAKLQF